MDHYVAGCWDAEIESSYGVLVGPSEKSGVAVVAQEIFCRVKRSGCNYGY
ncbi:putative glycine--tRNA ligase [Helianthus anomalus]